MEKVNCKDIIVNESYIQYEYTQACVMCAGKQHDILVRSRLPFTDKCQMVMDIASMMFREQHNAEPTFAPYVREFARYYTTISYFTNLELPEQPNDVMAFIESSNIMEMIASIISQDYLDMIFAEADQLVKYEIGQYSKDTKRDEVISMIVSILKTVDEKLQAIDVSDLSAVLMSLYSQTENGANPLGADGE